MWFYSPLGIKKNISFPYSFFLCSSSFIDDRESWFLLELSCWPKVLFPWPQAGGSGKVRLSRGPGLLPSAGALPHGHAWGKNRRWVPSSACSATILVIQIRLPIYLYTDYIDTIKSFCSTYIGIKFSKYILYIHMIFFNQKYINYIKYHCNLT